MITKEDINAFATESKPAITAAREYARRSKKGIPADRWYDGTQGARMVAQGIEAQAEMIEMISGAFLALWAEKSGATQLHTQDSKYAQKQEQ